VSAAGALTGVSRSEPDKDLRGHSGGKDQIFVPVQHVRLMAHSSGDDSP
jgi:hypothetical protein